MTEVDNGGANAIKGFNYQKSVIVLIAVLHYLSENDFEIFVETKDDIVVKQKDEQTYIQVKGKKLSLATLTKRPEKKDSILEKNLSNGEEEKSFYKVISPSFANSEKFLVEAKPRIFRRSAKVYSYTDDATDEISKKLPGLSKVKLSNSRLVLTDFKADIDEALTNILGTMAKENIPIDNDHGMVSIKELCLQIDQKSERKIKNDDDYDFKKFTTDDLSNIFSHTYKVKCFEDIIAKLGYTIAKQTALKNRRVAVGALYKSYYNDSKKQIEQLDILKMDEKEILDKILSTVNFTGVTDELDREAIVLDALSQVISESSKR